jgi:hypothetical protein
MLKELMAKTFETIKDFIAGIIDFFVDSVSDYDERTGEEKFSLGRGSWIVWFYSTIYFTFKAVVLSPYWYVVGLSTLGYVIGTKYIVSLNGLPTKVEEVVEKTKDAIEAVTGTN